MAAPGSDPGVAVACYSEALLNRVRTARGHLDAIQRMMEAGAHCPDVMKQLAAVGGLVDSTTRLVLRQHLEACVADTSRSGDRAGLVDELMDALKYEKHVAPLPGVNGGAVAQATS